jgi:hypothetical protein
MYRDGGYGSVSSREGDSASEVGVSVMRTCYQINEDRTP